LQPLFISIFLIPWVFPYPCVHCVHQALGSSKIMTMSSKENAKTCTTKEKLSRKRNDMKNYWLTQEYYIDNFDCLVSSSI
jgi:hypothetical protein